MSKPVNPQEDNEADDMVTSMRKIEAEREAAAKTKSDITGMDGEHKEVPRRRVKAVSDLSDIVMDKLLPATADEEKTRKRQISSSDVGVSFNQAPNLGFDDLKLADNVAAYGTATERKGTILEDDFQELMKEEEKDTFAFNHSGLSSKEAADRLIQYGRNELPEHIDPKWLIFLRQFWAPMPIMIWIAIIIEAGIQNWIDMGILLLIQFANASISFYETTKAGDAVAALKSSLKPTATVKRDGSWQVIDGATVVPGDTVLLGSGSAIPADCRVNGSEIDVDQAALTGESLPVTFYKGDSCKMGSTVVRGEVEATVEFTGSETFFGKTASLLKDTHERSHLQKILIAIMFVLVGLSITLCTINFIFLLLNDIHLEEALSFTIVILVASIPLAIEIVTTTTLAIGSKGLAKHGAIVAKLSAIEDLAGMSILCSDKTGTLTLNQMMLQKDTPTYSEGITQEVVLLYAAQAAKWKEPPRDALDRLTLGSVNMALLEDFEQLDYLPFDPQIKRTEGTVRNTKTGEEYKTSKGAPHIIMKLLPDSDNAVREMVEADVARLGACGIRSLAVARTNSSGVWVMIGLLTFLDPPRPDTKQTIIDANRYGVQVKMITGDHLLIARNTALQLEMGDKIFTAERLPMLDPDTKEKPEGLSETYGDLCLVADGFAQVYPEHKYLIVECLRELGFTTGMTGDGVNDAPALKRADIGIAVAGATDAARAAADIILTEEGLGTIIHGIILAREIFSRMSNFITYRISATLQLLLFFFIAVFTFRPETYQQPTDDMGEPIDEPWPEFFHMPVLMLIFITLLNDGTLITIAYDYAKASETPNRWNLKVLFTASSVLGLVSCLSSLILLHFLLDSWDPNGLFQKLNLDGVLYGQIITAIYLKVSVSDFLTLFSARTSEYFFWHVAPAPILFCGGMVALTASSLIAIFWPKSTPDDIPTEGLRSNIGLFFFVWIFCIIWWFIQDLAKVLSYKFMFATNYCQINQTGIVRLPESAKQLANELDKALAEEAKAGAVAGGKH